MFNIDHIHPLLVHFPIALILTGFLADVVYLIYKKENCLSKTGFYLMILGTISAGAAYVSGQLFASEPSGGAILPVFEKHETFALITLIILAAGSVLRIYDAWKKTGLKSVTVIVFVLYLLGAISVGITGFFGGSLVYNFMLLK